MISISKLLLPSIFVLIVSVIVEINSVDAPPFGKPYKPPSSDHFKDFRDTYDHVKPEKLQQPPSEERQEYNREQELNVRDKDILGIPKIYNAIVKTMNDPTFGMSTLDKLVIDFLNHNGGLNYIQNKDKKDIDFAVTKEFNKNYDEVLNNHLLEIMNLQFIVYFKYISEYWTLYLNLLLLL